jgi:hypothetical protein
MSIEYLSPFDGMDEEDSYIVASLSGSDSE